MDMLFDQFTDYQSLQDSVSIKYEHIDQIWHYLGSLQGCDGIGFNLHFEVVKYIITLANSHADEEKRLPKIEQNLELAYQTRYYHKF